jgi:cytochrome b6-f complex iron-sulfur subunit
MTEEATRSDDSKLTRRRFLALLTHGGWVAAMGVLVYQMGRFMRARDLQSSPKPVVVAGKLSDFPPGSLTYVGDARAWVENKNGNLKALDAVCSHMGCLVQKRETAVSGFQCPCHGSQYGADGAVERGPAERPLRHLSVDTTANDIVVIRT